MQSITIYDNLSGMSKKQTDEQSEQSTGKTSVQVDKDLHAHLQAEKRRTGVPIAEQVRRAIRRYLGIGDDQE